jgi:hypothetical protein
MWSLLIPILASVIGQGVSSAMQPRPNHFYGPADPTLLASNGVQATSDAYDAFRQNLARGVNLRSSFAQTPPTFAGGGLPMPVGVTGRDPALQDPSLLSLPGIQIGNPNGNIFGNPGPPRDPNPGGGTSGGQNPGNPNPPGSQRPPDKDVSTGPKVSAMNGFPGMDAGQQPSQTGHPAGDQVLSAFRLMGVKI